MGNTDSIYASTDNYKIFSPFIDRDEAKFLYTLKNNIPHIFASIADLTNAPVFYKPPTRQHVIHQVKFIASVGDVGNAFSYYFSKERQTKIFEFFYYHQRIRLAFRKLLFAWRTRKWQRHILNTEDPFTLCEPDIPLRVVDPASKGTYVFEAPALLTHIHKSLLHHDGFYDEPIFPKNPLTNIRFSLGQLHTIYLALQKSHWVVELFRLTHFSIARLQIEHAFSLKKHAIQSTFADVKSHPFISFVLDFIEQEYITHAKVFPSKIFAWAIINRMNAPIMQLWASLAKESALLDLRDECGFSYKNPSYINIKSIGLIGSHHFTELRKDYFLTHVKPPPVVSLQDLWASDSSSD